MVSYQEYEEMLRQLLPPGPAFPRGDYESMMAMLLEVFALELSRIDSRVDALVREDDPRVSVECFREWLEEWGLPDVCSNLLSNLTDSVLRQLLLFRITVPGGQSKKFFVELAARFGYEIQIDELRPYTVQSEVMDAMWSTAAAYTWRVNVLSGAAAENTTASMHTVIGGADEPLAWWGDMLLECLIERYKPAQTEVVYGYFQV